MPKKRNLCTLIQDKFRLLCCCNCKNISMPGCAVQWLTKSTHRWDSIALDRHRKLFQYNISPLEHMTTSIRHTLRHVLHDPSGRFLKLMHQKVGNDATTTQNRQNLATTYEQMVVDANGRASRSLEN